MLLSNCLNALVVCKCVVKTPLIVSCCSRLVGCKHCVDQWIYGNSTYPLCATNSASISFLELKGFEQVLTVAAMMENVPIDHVIATKEIPIPSPPTD